MKQKFLYLLFTLLALLLSPLQAHDSEGAPEKPPTSSASSIKVILPSNAWSIDHDLNPYYFLQSRYESPSYPENGLLVEGNPLVFLSFYYDAVFSEENNRSWHPKNYGSLPWNVLYPFQQLAYRYRVYDTPWVIQVGKEVNRMNRFIGFKVSYEGMSLPTVGATDVSVVWDVHRYIRKPDANKRMLGFNVEVNNDFFHIDLGVHPEDWEPSYGIDHVHITLRKPLIDPWLEGYAERLSFTYYGGQQETIGVHLHPDPFDKSLYSRWPAHLSKNPDLDKLPENSTYSCQVVLEGTPFKTRFEEYEIKCYWQGVMQLGQLDANPVRQLGIPLAAQVDLPHKQGTFRFVMIPYMGTYVHPASTHKTKEFTKGLTCRMTYSRKF